MLVDGQEVKVGDYLGYKADTEVYGAITKINGGLITIKCTHNDEPEYYTDDASRFWVD